MPIDDPNLQALPALLRDGAVTAALSGTLAGIEVNTSRLISQII
jgi:hypothetical protein